MATINASIVLISLPAIFRGIHLDPLAPGNVSYLLWMLMGYLLVTRGARGDARPARRHVRPGHASTTSGFVVFTIASIALSLDPFDGGAGALWLIGWRVVQGVGGAMLIANSTAILTDAFPADQRGHGAGHQPGRRHRRLVHRAGRSAACWPSGTGARCSGSTCRSALVGTVWSYRVAARDRRAPPRRRIDWWGNVTFAVGLGALLVGITYGIQPYGGHTMGWTNPWVLAGADRRRRAARRCSASSRRGSPTRCSTSSLFQIRAFAAGNLAGLLASIGRGGLQFMLIIWLQGIWLPLHGYDYESTPLWAGIYLLPLTVGLPRRRAGRRAACPTGSARAPFATGGLLLVAATLRRR